MNNTPPLTEQHSATKPKKKLGVWSILGIAFVGLCSLDQVMKAVEHTESISMAKAKVAAMTPEQKEKEYFRKRAEREAGRAAVAEREAAKRRPIARYTGIEITNIYHGNEVSADDALKGEFIQVTGKVKDIRKDFMDNIIIDLRGERGRYSFSDVHCKLDDSDPAAKRAAMTLAKGNHASLVCKVSGMIMKSVMLDECRMAQQ